MTDQNLDLAHIREAWQNASPAEVARGLNNPEDYPPAVRAIIQEVAEQRGIDVDCEETAAPETFVSVRRAASRIKPRLHAILQALLRLVQSHPFVSGAGLGILTPICGMALHSIFQITSYWLAVAFSLVLFAVLRVGGLVVICMPLRCYRSVIFAAAGATLTTGVIAMVMLLYSATQGAPGVFSGPIFFVFSVNVAFIFAAPIVLLSVVVWIRNRFYPVHEPGRCRVCDYDLRGLPEPRCPECGTAFDPSAVVLPSSADAP